MACHFSWHCYREYVSRATTVIDYLEPLNLYLATSTGGTRIGLAVFILVLFAAGIVSWRSTAVVDQSIFAKFPHLLWTVFLLNLCVSCILFVLSSDRNTAAAFAGRFLLSEPDWDSWQPMIRAIEHLRTFSEVPLYGKIFFADQVKFQYPISSLVGIDLLQRASGASWETVCHILNALSWWCVPLTAVVAGGLLYGSQDSGPKAWRPSSSVLFVYSACLLLAITYYPLVKSYNLGQIQTSITLYVALALLSWQKKRRIAAGFFIGLCCAIKPQWYLFLPWAFLRRQVDAGVACLLTAAILVLMSMGMYGFTPYFDYLPVLSFLSRHGEAYFPNQTINGLLNRLFANGNNLEWVANQFPPFDPRIYAATVFWGLLIVGMTFFRRRKSTSTVDLALLILSLTIASPIAWEHHYGLLFPIFALVTPACLQQKPFGRLSGTYLLVAYLLASQRFDFLNLFANSVFNPVQSYLLFGALMVLGLLYRLTSLDGSISSLRR